MGRTVTALTPVSAAIARVLSKRWGGFTRPPLPGSLPLIRYAHSRDTSVEMIIGQACPRRHANPLAISKLPPVHAQCLLGPVNVSSADWELML